MLSQPSLPHVSPQSRTTSERSDDIPQIVHWLLQLELPELLDEALPSAHGNRQGLSYGQLAGWRIYVTNTTVE